MAAVVVVQRQASPAAIAALGAAWPAVPGPMLQAGAASSLGTTWHTSRSGYSDGKLLLAAGAAAGAGGIVPGLDSVFSMVIKSGQIQYGDGYCDTYT